MADPMKPTTHEADDGAAFTQRDPFAAQDDRTPAELAAIRSLAAQLDALLDSPPVGAPPDDSPGPDEELEVTRDALPTLATTQVLAVVAEMAPTQAFTPTTSALESGLADRMRGVLRGVLDRARRNRPAR